MRLTDTLTGDPVELPPPPAHIGMYVCGPTVYQRAHIGNARPYLIASWLARWLRSRGNEVTLVHNITDVNDKIYEAAPGRSAERAREATAWYLEDVGRFGLDEVTAYPTVTESMPEIIAFVSELVERGHAYAVDGDVYFRVASYPDYGRLSGQRPDQVEEQEPNPRKEDARDFALWKANKPGEDTWWDSPWGRGRPGWHIECSAMADKTLGPEFWIHGGGLDLVFPHHENERAQSQAAGRPFARIWMHNGMLRFTGEKMSKSVGNIQTVQDVLDRWGKEPPLLFFLTAHWRKPIDFSEGTMEQARAQTETFRNFFLSAPDGGSPDRSRLASVLDEDFNTPDALALFHEWRAAGDAASLRWGLELFGLGALAAGVEAPADVVALADRRRRARDARDWPEADHLRSEIEARGWEVRDVADAPGFQLVPRP